MLNAVIQWSLRHRVVVAVFSLALLAAGVWRATHAAVAVLPDFAPPQVVIQTEAPGLAAEQVEQQVTYPIETALLGLAGVQDVRSTSIEGLSVVTVVFGDTSQVMTGRQQVGESLATVNALPPGVQPPQMQPLASPLGTMAVLGLTGARSRHPYALRTFADWTLRPRLLAVPGVANVTVYGGAIKQVQVVVSPARLRDYGVTLAQVLQATAQSSTLAAGGFYRTPGQDLVIHVAGQLHTRAALRASVVLVRHGVPLTLGEIATVRFGPAPPIGGAAVNGRDGVVLEIIKQPGVNTLRLTSRVNRALDALQASLPPGARLNRHLFRQATFIQTAIHELELALWAGGLLVVLVLLAFLRSRRAAAISLIAIPLSLLTAVLILAAAGASLNTMTLGGLVLALGEVVDDAIIDVENIRRRLHQNAGRRPLLQVVYEASTEVRGSVVFATLIVILVFVPVLLLGGLAGRVFAPLALAYILATLASLAVALTLTPVLSSWLLAEHSGERTEGRLLARLRAFYQRRLQATLAHPRWIGGVALAASALAAATLPFMGGAFLPAFNEGNAVVHMASIPGTSLAVNLRDGRSWARALLRNPAVLSVDQRTGRAALGDDTTPVNYTEFDVRFRPGLASRQAGLAAIAHADALYPSYAWSVEQFITERISEILSGETAPLAVKIFGPDLGILTRLANQVQAQMAAIPGAVNVVLAQQTFVPQVRIQFHRAAAQAYGVSSGMVTQAVQTAFFGTTVGQIYQGQQRFALVVRLPRREKASLDAIRQSLIPTPSGPPVPLSAVATVSVEAAPDLIARENGSRLVTVEGDVANGNLVGFVDALRARVARHVRLPAGYYLEYTGDYQARAQSTHRLEFAALAVLGGVVFLLFIAFGSLRLSLLVLFNVPMAFLGGVAAVWLSGAAISLATLIGFITLLGITTRNAIMLVSHFQHLELHEGERFGPALVVRGAQERLLPVLMTAAATGMALLPVALGGPQPGRELELPMALVIVGGLLTSTLLTLLVVPTLYLRFAQPAPQPLH